jgi:hypothetical protein
VSVAVVPLKHAANVGSPMGAQEFSAGITLRDHGPGCVLSVAMKKSPLVAKWRSPLVAR